MLYAIVIAGGKGERFWPLSRTGLPKQFLSIAGERTMLQNTIDRLHRLIPYEQMFVVTGTAYRSIVEEQIPELPATHVIWEPVGRDTAACIGLAAYKIDALLHTMEDDPQLLIVPADHYVEDEQLFVTRIQQAQAVLEETHAVVTIGIEPTYPETGYGYLEVDKSEQVASGYRVRRFLEKPSRDVAVQLISEDRYYWNSGMFLWHASTIKASIAEYLPELHKGLQIVAPVLWSEDEETVLEQIYPRLPAISVDYGIMEKVNNIYMIPGDFGWNDVGSWGALEHISDRDLDDNVILGNVLNIDTQACIIHSTGQKLIATLGIQDIIIVDTEDITLVCSKDKAQEIKELIKELKKKKWEAYL